MTRAKEKIHFFGFAKLHMATFAYSNSITYISTKISIDN